MFKCDYFILVFLFDISGPIIAQLPIIKSVGDEVYLSCNSPITSTIARWERVNGNLSEEAEFNLGVLRLPRIRKEDEGVYKCTVGEDEHQAMSQVELQINDFVPIFSGEDSLEFHAMSDAELKALSVLVTINATESNGVIFETGRRPQGSDKEKESDNRRMPTIEHRARLKDGNVVYDYNVGYGMESIMTPNKIRPNEWNTIIVKNSDEIASVQLNSERPTIKEHDPTIFQQGVNAPLIIGGHRDRINPNIEKDRFQGVISSVVISGEPLMLGEAERPETMLSFDACRYELCLNEGRCRPANLAKGYICFCSEGFTGDQCHIRSSTCRNEDCNEGICLESDETWQCVCPVNTAGIRCEEIAEPHRGPLGFQYDTSFVALPAPEDLDNLSVSLTVKPESTQDEHILLYLSSNYNPESRKHLSLAIINNAIVYTYSNGLEGKEKLRSDNVKPGEEYTITLIRKGPKTEFLVNGRAFESKKSLSSFVSGTNIFIGGLPPGVETPESQPEQSFRGCISQILINGVAVDFQNTSTYSSGDLTQCSAVFDQSRDNEQYKSEEHDQILNATSVISTEEVEHVYNTRKDADPPTVTPQPFSGDKVTEHPSTTFTSTIIEDDAFIVMGAEVLSTSAPLTTEDPCTSSSCEVDVCANHSCGMNGICKKFNESHYECECKLYYDGSRCNLFKPIEYAAQFDGSAFIEISADEFPHLTSEKDELVELKFKTSEPNGVLFWQGQQPGTSVVGEDYISVGIANGKLHFSYELGGGAAHMISEHRIDDGKEHRVRLERRGRRGSLRIDDQPEQRGLSSGILAMLNSDGNIFIGGVPDIYFSTGGLHSQNFKGCIADVSLNGEKIDLMGTAIDGKNVKPCEEWVAPKRWLKSRRRTYHSWTIL